jgi:type I restriction enzyme M protein
MQIRSKQFTQDIIDTLGSRIGEVVLPIPRDVTTRRELSDRTRDIVQRRALLREEAKRLPLDFMASLDIPNELVEHDD